MNEAIYDWMQGGWLPVTIFLVGWLGVGFVATYLLRKGSILGAFPAALFGVGGHMLVVFQIPLDYEPSVVTDILPVVAGLFCILAIFASFGRGTLKRFIGGKDEKESR